MTQTYYVGTFQPHLEDAFSEAVAAIRRRDPLGSIVVLVPTHVLGRHLMRLLAQRHGVCFNVRFQTFPDFAESVGLEALVASGRIPVSPLGAFLIARKAINAKVTSDGYFAPIRESPGTPRAVLITLTDLKKAGVTPDRLEEFSGAMRSKKLEEVAAIYREVERLQAEAGYFDTSECLAIASQAARSSSSLGSALAVCLYGFSDLNHLERTLFEACVADRPGYAFIPEDVGGYTQPLLDWLRSKGFATPASPGAPIVSGPKALAHEVFNDRSGGLPVSCDVGIVSAPGAAPEIQEVARHVLAYAATPGASFSDVAVLLRQPGVYERTLRDVFAAAGIPHVFLDGIPMNNTPAGRLLQLLVRIRRGDYPRADVMEFLGSAPLRVQLLGGPPEASPADWDRYSREAGIVGGREQWKSRVSAMRRRVESRVGRLRRGTAGPDDPRLAQLDRNAKSLRAFEHVINILLKRLEGIPPRGAIGELMGDLLRALLSVATLTGQDRGVVKALAVLARRNVADEEVTFDNFARLLEDLLAERLPPSDVYRTGRVVVSSLSSATGLPYKLVLIPGMVERSFPPVAKQDPILLDQEREALNTRHGRALAVRADRAVEERFSFRHALAAAEAQVVFTFPRLDAATGQVRVPSHYLLRVAEAVTGQPTGYDELGTLTDRIPAGRLARDDAPLNSSEWDLATVSRALTSSETASLNGLPGFAAMARGTRAEGSRWGRPRFTEFDGVLGIPVLLPQTMAATQMETYGLCPFKFFGERILRVFEIDEPEAVETISPLDRGSLIHDILDQFLSGLVKDDLVPMRTSCIKEYRERLHAIAAQLFQEFEKSGAVGYPFMWDVEQARILTDLEGFVGFECTDETGYVPAYFEARFGPTPSWATAPPGSMPHPLELPTDGGTLRLTGYVDRIDVSPAGSARVIDYKTGAAYEEKDNRFRGGQSLQLPIYLQAADAMLAHNGVAARTTEALYYYATAKGGFKQVRFTRKAFDRRSAEFATMLKTMSDGIAEGTFPQHPGKSGENCKWCSFQSACGHGRARLAERKRADPAIAAITRMWEIE
ncbi:MAG TPA: PD-(D/E)XK nuclease family protein [bacterium]|nr:PD-(D/E)XK nuclease family protein [bacterium]